MKFDELLFTHLGEFGRYQKIQFALICIPPMFVAMHSLSWTFTGSSLPHRCRLSEDEPIDAYYWTNSELLHTTSCNNSVFCPYEVCRLGDKMVVLMGTYTTTRILPILPLIKLAGLLFYYENVWDIVCDCDVLKAMIQSLYYIGQMAGTMGFGYLGDRIGRKKVFFIALVTLMASGTPMAIVPHWVLFGLLRFLVGVAHPGIFTIGVVIATELVGPSKRKMALVATGIFFALGQVVLGTLAYYLRDYQQLQLAISLPTFFFIIYWWIVPESARWLVSLKRYKEADKVLQRAARTNTTSLPHNWWEQLDLLDEKVDKIKAEQANYGYIDLVRTPALRKRTLTCFFLWHMTKFLSDHLCIFSMVLGVSMIYYGVSMKTGFLGGDLYSTFIIGSLSEISALLLLNCFADRIGRKPIFAGAYFIAAICMLSNLLLPVGAHWFVSILQFLLTNAAITICYAVIYMVTPELFPTVIRNSAVGCCSTIARIGAISASYIAMWLVESVGSWAMVLPFGTLSLVAGILVLWLIPETMGQPLPETIDEIELTEAKAEEKELALIDTAEKDNSL